jgi:hypothetical protein
MIAEGYFRPWISDKEPKAPKGWGTDICKGVRLTHNCMTCKGIIAYSQPYVYSYQTDGLKVAHNTERCAKDIPEYKGK